MLQERIEELSSAILDFSGDYVYVTGFKSHERLLSHSSKGIDNWSSKGRYPITKSELDYKRIKTNALFVIMENGLEKAKYQFKEFKKYSQKFKDTNGLQKTRVITIRKCVYTNQFNYFTMEESYLFASFDALQSFLVERFNHEVDLVESEVNI
ncbi:hypothetical protein COJ46_22005 [Bacillus sp. AFS077874]|uniref:hypothetical protein n=1 Tax=Bacillus sp. AFS077874 TaxID=2033513 RepID=UPI000BF2D7A4|nr:hypothetical protein [Bacillus sp. AFS077874]PFM75229.1 hypothetical protein COJ46_22005 [Bacillus sp. AFS077874]